jgi:phage-related protein
MKPIEFCGRSLEAIRAFPTNIKREAGHQLDRVQHGLEPLNWKPIPSLGIGIKEIRLSDNGQYRVMYLAAFKNSVVVLHAFQKKSQKTAKRDLKAAQRALKDLTGGSVS